MKDTILIASDHAGLALKNFLIKENPDLKFKDLGPYKQDSVDYPDFAHTLIKEFQTNEYSPLAVLICGSGQGMAITANKYKDIRAALCWNADIVKLSREHNNANILCLGERFVKPSDANILLHTFLTTQFEGGRHARRVDKITGENS